MIIKALRMVWIPVEPHSAAAPLCPSRVDLPSGDATGVDGSLTTAGWSSAPRGNAALILSASRDALNGVRASDCRRSKKGDARLLVDCGQQPRPRGALRTQSLAGV
jgi:hypothetical protein